MKKTICLNMIVKNEAKIIKDTLENILNYIAIDYWVICDTGSSDQTISIIQQFFKEKNISGTIHQHEWKNFAHNRQNALNAAAHQTDYVLFFDADDRIEGSLKLPEYLKHDAYIFKLYNDGMLLPRCLLVKNDQSFYWRSETHEVITPYNTSITTHLIEGDYKIQVGHFGARSQDPHKYLKDAYNLVSAFTHENNPQLKRRYAYFCGQSFMCAQKYDKAEHWLKIHIDLCQTKTEEIRYAYIVLGRLYSILSRDNDKVDAWLKAYDHAPKHPEAMVRLAEHYNHLKHYQLGFDFSLKAFECPIPKVDKVIILNTLVHEYALYYQLGISAYQLKQYPILYQAVLKLMDKPELNSGLNLFIIESCLYLFKDYILCDKVFQQKLIYDKILNLQQLNELAEHKRRMLIERFEQHFNQINA